MRRMSDSPEDFLRLSDQAVDDIEKMMNSGVSVRPLYSRLYYAVFYSAKAALLSEGVEARTHRGTASQAYQVLFDQKELIEKEDAMVLQRLQERRDMADYELEVNFDRNEFKEDYEDSKDFVSKMKDIVESE